MKVNYHVQMEGITQHWITIFRTGSEQEAKEQCENQRRKHTSTYYRIVKLTEEIIKC